MTKLCQSGSLGAQRAHTCSCVRHSGVKIAVKFEALLGSMLCQVPSLETSHDAFVALVLSIMLRLKTLSLSPP